MIKRNLKRLLFYFVSLWNIKNLVNDTRIWNVVSLKSLCFVIGQVQGGKGTFTVSGVPQKDREELMKRYDGLVSENYGKVDTSIFINPDCLKLEKMIDKDSRISRKNIVLMIYKRKSRERNWDFFQSWILDVFKLFEKKGFHPCFHDWLYPLEDVSGEVLWFWFKPKGEEDDGFFFDFNANIGDTLCLTPVLRAWKKKHHGKKISLRTRYPELFYFNPHVDEIVFHEKSCRFEKKIKLRVPSGPKERNSHISVALAKQIDIELDNVFPDFYLKDFEKNKWDHVKELKSKKTVAVCPFSNWESRNVPLKKIERVMKGLEENTKCSFVFLNDSRFPYPGFGVHLGGMLGLRDCAAILARCSLFLGADNGMAHLAAAVKTQGVVFFGPVLGRYRTYDELTFGVSADPEEFCVGCFHRKPAVPRLCPLETYECIKNIDEGKVISVCSDILNSGRYEE